MGLIDRVAGWAGFERRDRGDQSWSALAPGLGYHAGLSARAAENLSTVLACTNAIATALAYVPPLVYRRDGEGNRIELPTHPMAKIARTGVNDQMSWPDFLEHFVASTLLTGNGLAVILRNGNGQLVGFRYVPWGMVTVAELSSGRLAYDVSDGRGNTRRYLEGEVLHLRDRTDDGKIGRSRLSRAAETVASVQAASSHASAFLANGASPSGVIEVAGTLTPAQRASLRTSFQERHAGVGKAGSTLILDGGMKWNASQISPEDAELLETRKFGVIELCRLFQVPPPIVQAYENNTFTNAAQAGLWFATFCLAPWARKIEAEFARSVFPSGGPYELELDLSGFLRGDPETRWNAHKIAIEAGVLDPDEVRQIEGWNPRPAGQRPARANAGGQTNG
ncbi:phage portal protein [Prosthecomicrobium hirschii]|uniref:phage portal protein n=1 Tax=Prosthecodimorpha hirschii TaxID=665126 RepID=UPI00221E6BBF|nr:phage portal protein [Prosthecomicrobium hirschii]MCW1840438.1 phage portal protein [Prosthecomicrobium hirschii]